jgi:hypothetical protein
MTYGTTLVIIHEYPELKLHLMSCYKFFVQFPWCISNDLINIPTMPHCFVSLWVSHNCSPLLTVCQSITAHWTTERTSWQYSRQKHMLSTVERIYKGSTKIKTSIFQQTDRQQSKHTTSTRSITNWFGSPLWKWLNVTGFNLYGWQVAEELRKRSCQPGGKNRIWTSMCRTWNSISPGVGKRVIRGRMNRVHT